MLALSLIFLTIATEFSFGHTERVRLDRSEWRVMSHGVKRERVYRGVNAIHYRRPARDRQYSRYDFYTRNARSNREFRRSLSRNNIFRLAKTMGMTSGINFNHEMAYIIDPREAIHKYRVKDVYLVTKYGEPKRYKKCKTRWVRKKVAYRHHGETCYKWKKVPVKSCKWVSNGRRSCMRFLEVELEPKTSACNPCGWAKYECFKHKPLIVVACVKRKVDTWRKPIISIKPRKKYKYHEPAHAVVYEEDFDEHVWEDDIY